MITRRTTFRLYPTKAQEQILFYWKKLHCLLYNAAVANRRTQYKRFGKSVDYYEQQNCLPEFKKVWVEYQELNSQSLQATLKRVDLAYQSFFKGLRGYPKFKASRHYSGWTYPANTGWKAMTNGQHGKLHLSKLGYIKMRGQVRTWGDTTSCTIFYRHGKWYASITVKCQPERTTDKGAVGIDLGCVDAITFDSGEAIVAPKFYKQTLEKVGKLSKDKRRKRASNKKKKTKASRRWRKAQAKVSKVQRKAGRQRKDWAHKTTTIIVSSNSLVVGEKLTVKNMTRKAKKGKPRKQKSGLNRSILDTGMGMISKMLAYKEEEAGGMYLESPTKTLKPTQRCHSCWTVVPKQLSERTHSCTCGTTCGRDENAAKVNLKWALGTSVLSRGCQTSTPIPQNTGGWAQVWQMKRLKPLARRSEAE
jgi:putative transposase